MKLKEFKPVYPQVLLYATTYERNYIKVLGVGDKSTFEKYYAGQLFENLSKGNLYEGYTQPANVGNFRRDAFNIVSIAIQNTILPEIVSVQPINIRVA